MTDYIPRLREELVAAAAREQAGQRHRPRLRPRRLVPVLATAAVVAAVVAAVLVVELPRDETSVAPAPAVAAHTYRVTPVTGTDAAAAAREAAGVLRERLAAAGIHGATVTVDGDRIRVVAGSASPGEIAALTVPGSWGSSTGRRACSAPSGRPEPGKPGVTGGSGAGVDGAVSRDEAARRVAKADSPSARIVRAAAAGRLYALDVGFAIDNADIASARRAARPRDGRADRRLRPRCPRAADVPPDLTRGVARRGADAARPGDDPLRTVQHFAIVLDDGIASVPFIDHREVPDGIDGRGGVQIQGGLSPERARQIAAILDAGPLPATLEPVDEPSP